MEEEEDVAGNVAAALQQASTTEKRVAALQLLQMHVEQAHALDEHVDELTESLRLYIKQPNILVSSKALSVVPAFVGKLAVKGDHDVHRSAMRVRSALHAFVVLLADRLGDQRERTREGAKLGLIQLAISADAVSQLQQHSHASAVNPHALGNRSSRLVDETLFGLFERLLTEAGLKSKVAKVREHSTMLLATLRDAITHFPLKPFLATLVEHLSDADSGVREASRSTIVALFKRASATAKGELKREMERKEVRQQTIDAILSQIMGEEAPSDKNGASTVTKGTDASTLHARQLSVAGASANRQSTRSPAVSAIDETGTSASSRSASRLGGSIASSLDSPDVRKVYITSAGELERTFSAMLPFFEGKETEHNWQSREQSILKIRGMLKSSTHEQYPSAFAAGVQRIADGILKAVASLRTTLGMHGISLVAELAQHLGDNLEGVAEVFLTALVKMAGFTKKIVANASQNAAAEILRNVSYKRKYLDLIASFLAEKNQTIRTAMCQHMVTLLNTHGRHRKHALEQHGGIDTIVAFCKKALADANKDVRATAREVFYTIEEIWPVNARSIFETLDPNAQRQIEANRASFVTSATAPVHGEVPSSAATPVALPTPASARSSSQQSQINQTEAVSPRKVATPGRASNALLAAKRAAAAAMAEERKREQREREEAEAAEAEEAARQEALERAAEEAKREEEAAEAAGESLFDTTEVDEEEMEEQRRLSPSPPPRVRSSSRLSVRSAASPSKSAAPMRSPPRRQTPSLPPSSIPLPVSSSPTSESSSGGSGGNGIPRRPPSALQGARSRTTSTSSVSSNRSAAASRFGSAAATERYGSIAQRFDQSPSQNAMAAKERRTLKHAPNTPTSPSRAISPSRLQQNLPTANFSSILQSDSDGRDKADGDESGLGARPLEQSAQTRSPASPTGSQSTLKQPRVPFTPHTNNEDIESPSRSRLPRPISTMASPANSTKFSSEAPSVRSPASSSSSQPSHLRKASDSTTTPRSDVRSSSLPHQIEEVQQASTLGGTEGSRERAQKSSVPANAPTATKWFLGKVDRLDNARLPQDEQDIAQLSPVKRRPESQDYIAQLLNGRASLRTFKGLVALSKEFKLPQNSEQRDAGAEGEEGSLGLRTNGDDEARDEVEIAVRMWQEERLFERLFDALCTYLRNAEAHSNDLQTAALVLLHRLVEHQFGLFVAQGREHDLIEVLFELVKKSSSAAATSGVKSACQAIADRWADQGDSIIGISTLRHLLGSVSSKGTHYQDDDDAASATSTVQIYTLSLRSLARLFARLPAELIEEQMETCKSIVKFGLGHRQIELRQQAVGVLVAANKVLHDPQSLFTILQPIDKSQQDLLVYYMNKVT